LLAHDRWFSSGTPASSTTKTGRHDIAEILLKVALSTKKIKSNQSNTSPVSFTNKADHQYACLSMICTFEKYDYLILLSTIFQLYIE
jgi:hypothetical protein